MTVAFLGLTGPSGVLPHVYTELLLERERAGDHTLAAFLDLFNHRLISLFYRAWEKHHVLVGPRARRRTTASRAYLFALIGLGTPPAPRPARRSRTAPCCTYAGFFAQRHRPAVVLEALLARLLRTRPSRSSSSSASWLALDPGDRSTLGPPGRHNALGVEPDRGRARLGRAGQVPAPDRPARRSSEFRAFLPDGRRSARSAELARLFVDAEFDFDVQLVLKAEEVPPAASRRPRRGRSASGAAPGLECPLVVDRDVDPAEIASPSAIRVRNLLGDLGQQGAGQDVVDVPRAALDLAGSGRRCCRPARRRS